jgi:hypothetical protein
MTADIIPSFLFSPDSCFLVYADIPGYDLGMVTMSQSTTQLAFFLLGPKRKSVEIKVSFEGLKSANEFFFCKNWTFCEFTLNNWFFLISVGVDFTNILRTAFTPVDPKSPKSNLETGKYRKQALKASHR